MEFIGVGLSDKMYDTITDKILKSYPKACVLYIDQVKNDTLLEKYNKRKASMESMRGEGVVKEMQLFHGTKYANIDSIATNGFITTLNKTSAFGIGTYFSTSATYSKDFMDADKTGVSYMFVCDVLIGKMVQGSSRTIIDSNMYDNAVDKMNSPGMYICPHDDMCFPKYLVAFHKKAV